MRRLPVYLLLDTSGSMSGTPIQAVNNGLQVLVSKLRQDPFAFRGSNRPRIPENCATGMQDSLAGHRQ